MKLQTLLTTLYYLLFSSSAKQINDTSTGPRDTRAPKGTIIYHNGYPLELHGIPQQAIHYKEIQGLASDAAPNKAQPGPKVALQRDKIVFQNENTFLQDSYGNRYFSPPQSLAYKETFPQRYVALQDLPAHFPRPSSGSTQSKQVHTPHHFSFHDQFNRPSLSHPTNEQVIYDFGKQAQSSPLVLQHQQLNVPIQTQYRIAEAIPYLTQDQHPVTYSFHPSPEQHFINFAPERQHSHSGPRFHSNVQSSSNILNRKIQYDKSKSHPNPTQSDNVKQHKNQAPKKNNEQKSQTHASQGPRTVDPKYFKPQVFNNPIVPQVQHYLPQIQSVLQYNIIPRPEAKIVEAHEGRSQKEEVSVEKKIHQIVSSPENKHKIVINEYTPPEKHEHKEEVKAEVIDEEVNGEKNFDEGYHNAAKGFPAFSYNDDYAKRIFDESSYGEPHYHESISYGPPEESFSSDPKEHRASKYVTTGSIQHNQYGGDKPREYKPISYNFDENHHHSSKDKTRNSPVRSSLSIHSSSPRNNEQNAHEIPHYFGRYAKPREERREGPSKPAEYEFDFSKGYIQPNNEHHDHQKSRDDSSSRFVEPQYQYGFEPIVSEKDSEEQASSASVVAHDSETNPSTMKRVYKKNWFISKTSSSGVGTDS